MITTVTLTEFRSHASGMLSRVEHGETLVVLKYGRPIAEVSPASHSLKTPSWKKTPIRIVADGASLSSVILAERE